MSQQTLASPSAPMFTNQALRRLILPLVVEQVLVMLVGIADTVMVSAADSATISGAEALSGVALVDMVSYLIITLLTALATGGAVIVAQYLGNRQGEQARRAAGQLVSLTFWISAGVTVVCVLLHKAILRLLFGSIDPNVMDAATSYFFITAFSIPFIGLYNSSAALFRSMEKTGATMRVSLLMNAINIVGNAIGVYVLKAGIAGVAVPTLISRMVAGLLMTGLAFRKSNPAAVSWANVLHGNADIRRRILKIAVPNGIENGLFALGRVLVTSIVALFGTDQIAANGIAGSVDMIAIVVVSAVNLAIVTVIGQCVGANEYGQARLYMRKLMKVSYLATGALTLLVLAATPLILSLYNVSAETARLSFILILMHNVMATLLHPTSFNLSNGIRAAGDAKFTMVVGIASMIVFRLGSALLFGVVLNLGVIGVWIAMGMDWLARSFAFGLRFRGHEWETKRAI